MGKVVKEKIWNRIADFLEGKSPAGKSDGIGMHEHLFDALLRYYGSRFKGIEISKEGFSLTLWLNDNALFCSVEHDENFKGQITALVQDELGIMLSSVHIVEGVTPEGVVSDVITEGVEARMEMLGDLSVTKARITVLPGRGSLVKEEYLLDSNEISSRNGHSYNIGVGESPMLADGSYRINHIAIEDNLASPQYDRNRYVSRAHAHIGYAAYGKFLLFVEYGGTRMAQKRTRILRGNKVIELNDTRIPEPLENGDLIELGKSVVLLFEYR